MARINKKGAGRPTVFTPEVIRKIEEVAALDGSVAEMAYYAGIHVDSIYAKLKGDTKFSDRIKALRERPILLARQTAVKKLSESYTNAIDYLSRKRKIEFSSRSEHTGADGGAIKIEGFTTEEQTRLLSLLDDGNRT